MVSQRVAELYNAYVVQQSRDVPGSARRNLSSGEKKELDNLISNWQSSGVAQALAIERIKEAEGIPQEQPIGIGAISPTPEGFIVDPEQRAEALERVGAGRRVEISEREMGIEARRGIYEQLGLQIPGEAKREVLGFFAQQTIVPEQPYITERQIDIFESPTGQKIPITEGFFVDPETGFTGILTPEEERIIRERKQVVVPFQEEERIPLFTKEFSMMGLEPPEIKPQRYEEIEEIFQPARESIGEIRMGGRVLGERVQKQTFGRLEETYGITPEKIGEIAGEIAPISVLGFKTPKFEYYTKEFVTGVVEEPFYHPLRTGITFAAFAAMPGITKLALGKPLSKLALTYPKATPIISKGVSYSLYGAYGISAGARIVQAPSPVRKFGGVLSGEVLPIVAGLKLGTYGVRRAELSYERKQILKGESELLPKGFKFKKTELAKIQKEFKISQAFRKVQPRVRELSFKGMERITPKQQEIIKAFLGTKKGEIIIGGTAGVRGQLLTKEVISPHDIDVFVKGFRQQATSKLYLRELSKQLGLKVKGGAIRTPTGEKIIEFKPFKEYLQFNIEQVAPYYRTYRAGITKTPEGFKVLRLGFQAQQKILGYARYGAPRTKDIIWYFTAGKPSILKQAQLETVGKKVFDVKSPIGQLTVPKGITILGTTKIDGAIPKWIQIRKGLPPRVRQEVLAHELIHAKHPLWGEAKVSGIIGEPEIRLALKGVKPMAVSEISYPSYSKALSGFYPSYAKSPTMFDVPIYPVRKKVKEIPYKPTYKPTKEIVKTPYPKKEVPYLPYKPLRITPVKYKPSKITTPPPIIIEEPTITPTKKKEFLMFDVPRLGRITEERLLPRRIYQPQPSYKAVYGEEFGFETPKMEEALERTGIIERAYKAPKIIKPLGAFKV